VDFFGIHADRRVAQFIAGETVEMGVVCVQFGAELSAADFVPAEGLDTLCFCLVRLIT
jgi:hypothetical protein